MNVRTAYFMPMMATNTYRVEIWTGTRDIKELITLDHDYDALESLVAMLAERHPEITALDATFRLVPDTDKDWAHPQWCSRYITAQVAIA